MLYETSLYNCVFYVYPSSNLLKDLVIGIPFTINIFSILWIIFKKIYIIFLILELSHKKFRNELKPDCCSHCMTLPLSLAFLVSIVWNLKKIPYILRYQKSNPVQKQSSKRHSSISIILANVDIQKTFIIVCFYSSILQLPFCDFYFHFPISFPFSLFNFSEEKLFRFFLGSK